MTLPLTCRVSVEKSADNFMGLPLYIICHFYLVAFNILSLFLIFVSLITMPQCVPPWVYPAWDSLCFLGFVDYFCSHVRNVSSYYLFIYFLRSFLQLFSFWDPYNMNVSVFNVEPEVSGYLHLFSFCLHLGSHGFVVLHASSVCPLSDEAI